ncbi:MAG: RDD family protein [Prosthecobacter sp.]|uniref:RDD family protein n=1 Tax=Prosthecobacter sp. TaxID=1965333 RepID=UPI0025FCB8D8|nr:RDD family protein [Prosthecobacter sp.]MCF7786347.1 RDD family protein [Prosthecobacter sp.]
MNPYQIARDGLAMGEFVESQIQEGLQTGYFQPTDWCWREGMSEWQGLDVVFQRSSAQPVQQMPQPTLATAVNPYAAPRANLVGRLPQASSRVYVEKASPGSRLAAHILDILVFIACFLPAGLMSETALGKSDLMAYVSFGLLGIVCLINLILIATDGQTIGKKLMGIRIAQIEDSTKAGFIQIVFLRTLLGKGALGLIPFYSLVDALFIFNEDRRCIHDKIGGTHVVKVLG